MMTRALPTAPTFSTWREKVANRRSSLSTNPPTEKVATMPPTAAVCSASVAVQLLPSSTNTNTVVLERVTSPFLALQKEVDIVRKEIFSLLHTKQAVYREEELRNKELRVLVQVLTHRLTSRSEHTTDGVTMLKAHQLVVRVCEYADMVVQSCIGSACASGAKGTTAKAHDRMTKVSERTTTSPPPPSPVKSEEIRRASEIAIDSSIQPFELMQSELSRQLAQACDLRARLETMVAQTEEGRATLYKLESWSIHRLDRARVRYIRFIVRLEEEWLMDLDSIDANNAPCSGCAKHRLLTAPVPYSPPTSATIASDK